MIEKGNLDIIRENLGDTLIEIIEDFLDNKISLDSLRDLIGARIPIISTLLGVYGTIIGIRDRAFIRKFFKFILECHSLSQKEKNEILEKINEDNRLEMQIIVIIDKIEEEEITLYIKNLLKNYAANRINQKQFFRYMKFLTNLTYLDIKYLLEKDKYFGKDEESLILSNQGLLRQKGITYAELNGEVSEEILNGRTYVLTSIGENFINAID